MKARDNPFRTERVDALAYRAEGFAWEALEARLHDLGGRGAIVGPEGYGKSTLLRDWVERIDAAGQPACLVRLEFGQRRLHETQRRMVSASDRIFLDSAEQLGWLGWREVRRLTARAASLVITTHTPGRLPTLHECRSSPALLAALVEDLGESSAGVGPLWTRHHGNIRLALRSLYDERAFRSGAST